MPEINFFLPSHICKRYTVEEYVEEIGATGVEKDDMSFANHPFQDIDCIIARIDSQRTNKFTHRPKLCVCTVIVSQAAIYVCVAIINHKEIWDVNQGK